MKIVRTFAIAFETGNRRERIYPPEDDEMERKRNRESSNAGWSRQLARQIHNLKVAGAEPAPATKPIEWQHKINEKSEAREDC